MQKSIFYKYFRSTAAVVAASILVLGSLFMIFASDYFKEDKRETMQQQITITSSLLLANSEYDGEQNRVVVNSSAITEGLRPCRC